MLLDTPKHQNQFEVYIRVDLNALTRFMIVVTIFIVITLLLG